jgi:hypothetical protein
MIKARCVRPCTWNRRYWNAGEIYAGEETPPKHFEIVEELESNEPKQGRKKERKEEETAKGE